MFSFSSPIFSSPRFLKLTLLDCKIAEKYSSHSIFYSYTVFKGFDQKLIWAAEDHLSSFPTPSSLLFFASSVLGRLLHCLRGLQKSPYSCLQAYSQSAEKITYDAPSPFRLMKVPPLHSPPQIIPNKETISKLIFTLQFGTLLSH